MTILLELNDLGVRAYQEGELLFESPGYALVEKNRVILGEEARQQARLHPLNLHNDFWSELTAEPIHSPNPQVRHNADLVYLHLEHLNELAPGGLRDQPIVCSLPGHTPREHLSMLLGIAQQSKLKIVALVDTALASMVGRVQQQAVWHVEMHLHYSVISQLALSQGELKRTHQGLVKQQGWLAIQNHLLQFFTDAFIEQTRFDPRHSAASEQALLESIPEWMEQARLHAASSQKVHCELERHHVELDGATLLDQIHDSLAELRQRLHSLDAQSVFLGDRLSLRASYLPIKHRTLDPEELAAGYEHLCQSLPLFNDGLRFISALPSEVVNSAPQIEEDTRPAATHILCSDRAFPLNRYYSIVDSQSEDMLAVQPGEAPNALAYLNNDQLILPQGTPLLLNDAQIHNARQMKLGDRLILPGWRQPLQLIVVEG
jgi:hypothetical protein